MSDRGDIERVLGATDIVRVVRERIELKQKGREWVGLCPFHDDRSPSMFVSPAKQIFKCFACGAGGDALTFVQKYDGVEFPQALEHLAEAAGVELTPRGQRAPSGPGRSERAGALEANSFAQDFFRRTLVDPQAGKPAREMIQRRGISPEMVEAFGVGAAPAGWDGLVQAALRARKPMDAFALAQLVRTREQGGGQYDVFRNRLMFPIHDQGGRVIAFGGRRLSEDDPAKYLNSPESVVFKKSGVLYGLWKATAGIRQAGFCIVTEGYTDTIACHQAGFT
ncbi:MAG: DNA primase, partial [Phycisphaerales bacterium JB064]